ncbi:MAG: hypothetical protein ACPLXP_01195 [Microgenomates group bacterium]
MALPEAQIGEKEKLPVRERPATPEIPPEIEHVEAIAGAEIILPQPITDTGGGIILDNAAPQQVTITLPLTEEEMQQALHLKIIYSLRWLAEWAKRLIKIVGGKFIYTLK